MAPQREEKGTIQCITVACRETVLIFNCFGNKNICFTKKNIFKLRMFVNFELPSEVFIILQKPFKD